MRTPDGGRHRRGAYSGAVVKPNGENGAGGSGVARLDTATGVELAAPPVAARLSASEQVELNLLWFGLNLQSAALLPVVVPAQVAVLVAPGVAGAGSQAWFVGWLLTVGAVLTVIGQPVAGHISDRVRWRAGRRHPLIAAGLVVMLGGIAGLAFARNAAVYVVGFVLISIGGAVSTGAYECLIPDRAGEHDRGRASGYMGVLTLLGSVASLAIAAIVFGGSGATTAGAGGAAVAFYALTTPVLVLTTLITIRTVPDPPARNSPVPAPGGTRAWLEPWRYHNFRWVFVSRALVMLGIAFFMTFIEYYLARIAGISDFAQATAAVAMVALTGAVFGAALFGSVSDRTGRVSLVFVATLMMGAAALLFFAGGRGVLLWPVGILFGVGYGAFTSVDWALAIDALPSSLSVGRDFGIWSVATTAPAALGPVLGGGLIALTGGSGYQIVFGLAALSILVGAVSVLRVDEELPPRAQRRSPRVERPVRRTGSTPRPRRHPLSAPFWWLIMRGQSGDGHAGGVLRVWLLWERLYLRLRHVRTLPGCTVIRIEVRRHRGQPVSLGDGTAVRGGDRIVELHLANRRVAAGSASETWSPFHVLASLRADLAVLSRHVAAGELGTITAVHAVSLVAPALARVGFDVEPLRESAASRLLRFYLVGLLAVHSPDGWRSAARARDRGWPAEAWMSATRLTGGPAGAKQ